jgi:hypothetical protein
VGITLYLATAVRISEPGISILGIKSKVAGLGGRTQFLGSNDFLATAFR